MEKKAYIAPMMKIHGLMVETVILAGSETPNNLLNSGGIRMGTQTALAKGGGGPIIDDDDDDFDF